MSISVIQNGKSTAWVTKRIYQGQRHGLTIGIGGAYQGATDLFAESTTLGSDFLFNWGPWNLDGEIHWLIRERPESIIDEEFPTSVSSYTGHLRLTHNIMLNNGRYLEPVGLFTWFNGPMERVDQQIAIATHAFAGQDFVFDVGLNYYLNPNWAFTFHYTFRDGDAGDFGDGATFNNYFFQNGVGAIQRGDWLGIGTNIIL